MMTDDALFREMDQIADTLCAGSTLVDDLKFEFRQLQKCYCPELTTAEWHAAFDRWRAQYRARQQAKDDANDAKALGLLAEQSHLATQCRFLPPGPLRASTEKRLWQLGLAIGEIYRSRRPEVAAASWASDSEA